MAPRLKALQDIDEYVLWAQSQMKEAGLSLAAELSREYRKLPPKPARGRPRSEIVNGPQLRLLRNQAGMTQAQLVAAVKLHTGQHGAIELKSIQRYENSGAAERSNLEAIAAVLAEKLPRPVNVKEIML
jgi:hypothetical protein